MSEAIGPGEVVRSYPTSKSLAVSPVLLVDPTALDAVEQGLKYDYLYIESIMFRFMADTVPTSMSFTASRKIEFFMKDALGLYFEFASPISTGSGIYHSILRDNATSEKLWLPGHELTVVGTGLNNQPATSVDIEVFKVFRKKA
jgi:hypothetical protein